MKEYDEPIKQKTKTTVQRHSHKYTNSRSPTKNHTYTLLDLQTNSDRHRYHHIYQDKKKSDGIIEERLLRTREIDRGREQWGRRNTRRKNKSKKARTTRSFHQFV